MIGFGLIYLVWGVRHAIRHKPHTHWHVHPDGTLHNHEHTHTDEHLHVHTTNHSKEMRDKKTSVLTPWILFTIFLFGPCELLIPLLMYPAARSDVWLVVSVVLIFGFTTVAVMTLIVAAVHISLAQTVMHRISGMNYFRKYSRFGHAVAGFVVLLCGTTMLLL